MADEKISYSDIIAPDDSITNLVNQLKSAQDTFSKMSETIKKAADSISAAVNKAKTNTNGGKKALDDMALAAERLAKLQRELALTTTAVGREIAWTKSQIVSNNKASVLNRAELEAAVGSYNKLKLSLQESRNLWKSLSDVERSSSLGKELSANIRELDSQLKALDSQLKAHTVSLSQLEKAEKQLSFLQSEEGQKTLAVKQQIADLTRQKKEEAAASNSEAIASSRLAQLQRELALSTTAVGKEIAYLKSQIANNNKESALNKAQIEAAVGSYNKLKLSLQESRNLWKSLSDVERSSFFGQALAQEIRNLDSQLKALDSQLKVHAETLTLVEKEEQKHNYLLSEEGKRYIELRQKNAELVRKKVEEKQVLDAVTVARNKQKQALSEEARQVAIINAETEQAVRLQKLEAKVLASKEGSLQNVSARYALVSEKLSRMSLAERTTTVEGKRLVSELTMLSNELVRFEAASARGANSLHNLERRYGRLQFSIVQVVREVPSLAVSFSTFALAISNNVPMVIDEIDRLRAANKKLAELGKPTQSVFKTITGAIFSFNTALVLGLTAITLYGKQIGEFFSSIFNGSTKILSATDALSSLTTALTDLGKGYAKNIISFKQLTFEYKNLKTEAEKIKWIKDNEQAFRELGLQVQTVTEADRIFIKNTNAVNTALFLRAKAAAAAALAQEEYGKALQGQFKKDSLAEGAKDTTENVKSAFTTLGQYLKSFFKGNFWKNTLISFGFETADTRRAKAIDITAQRLQKEIDSATANAEQFQKYARQSLEEAAKILKEAGISEYEKPGKLKEGKGKTPRDLTDTIHKNDIEIQKKYETSLTNLVLDEYEKRRREITTTLATETASLLERKRKNEEYIKNVGNKYKALTAEQRKQIEEQNRLIDSTITNYSLYLSQQIANITTEQKVAQLQLKAIFTEAKVYWSSLPSEIKEVSEAISKLPFFKKGVNQNTTWSVETLAAGKISGVDVKASKKEGQNVLSEEERIGQVKDFLQEEFTLRKDNIDKQEALELKSHKELLEQGKEDGQTYNDIVLKFLAKRLEAYQDYYIKVASFERNLASLREQIAPAGSSEQLQAQLAQNKQSEAIALAENRKKQVTSPAEAVPEELLKAIYKKKEVTITANFELKGLEQIQSYSKAIFNSTDHFAEESEIYQLKLEKELWSKKIELAKNGGLDWSDTQIKTAEQTIKGIDKKIKKLGGNTQTGSSDYKQTGFKGFLSNISTNGLGGSILKSLNIVSSDEQLKNLQAVTNQTISFINDIMQAEIDLAQVEVDLAEKKTEAMQSAYDAEVEARNNGYANNVATSKKELQLAKKQQTEKQKLLEQAQRRQEAVNTAMQITSLVTASAELWKSFAGTGPAAPFLAAAAIATMWTSFAVSKIKARQAASAQSQAEKYGTGGLEFLEGGSHASGNDIDLQTKNKKGRNMRAEGGEALAIINKRNTRKYKKELPSIIDSLNKGLFEEKYANTFSCAGPLTIAMSSAEKKADLTRIEKAVEALQKQTVQQNYVLPTGDIVIKNKNVTRIIHN